ncbi:MAG TPA: histidine phosphatase family protein [Terriglobales bacterium]|jgi:broad specificity phosphatase PhoE|nr:histidine phosphatase family protein [Terriglobales bacterium]
MGRIFLVRHAQASFGEHNYDKLSATGEAQARLLGEYWAERRMQWDRVLTGPRVRQKDTVAIVSEAYRKARLGFPEPEVLPAFDEYHGDAVLERGLPGLVARDAEVQQLYEAFESSGSAGSRMRNFQKLFEAVIGRWVEGEIPIDGIESWAEFCARVQQGLAEVVAGDGRGRQVAIVTSGGPISVAMQRALELTAQNTLRVAWMVRNCATSEFLASGGRFTLSSFNEVAHLDDAALLTYR